MAVVYYQVDTQRPAKVDLNFIMAEARSVLLIVRRDESNLTAWRQSCVCVLRILIYYRSFFAVMHMSLLNWKKNHCLFSICKGKSAGVDIYQLGLQLNCISWLPIHDANVFPRSYTLIALFSMVLCANSVFLIVVSFIQKLWL